jgi:hypothetical protein
MLLKRERLLLGVTRLLLLLSVELIYSLVTTLE